MTDTPSQEDIDLWNAEVQAIIDRAAALGESLTYEEAATRLSNTIKNVSENPDYKAPDERLEDVESQVANHEDRIAYLEDVQGGTVVGPDA